MEIRVLFLLSLSISLLAAIPFDGSFASFDNGMGTAFYSPLLPVSYKQDSTKWLFEMGAISYYEYSLTRSEEQLYSAHWGASYKLSPHQTVATSLVLFSAFELYQELYPHISYGWHGKRYTLSMTFQPMFASVADESVWEWGGDCSGGVLGKNISLVAGWEVSHYDPDTSDLQEHRFYAFLRTKENRLGSQGARVSYALKEEKFSFSLAETMILSPWFSIHAALQSAPFFLFLGVSFSLEWGRGGFLMTRHPMLGWSKGGTLQYYDK